MTPEEKNEFNNLRAELETTANLNLVLAAKVTALEKTLIEGNLEILDLYTKNFTSEIKAIEELIKQGIEENVSVN